MSLFVVRLFAVVVCRCCLSFLFGVVVCWCCCVLSGVCCALFLFVPDCWYDCLLLLVLFVVVICCY